MPDPSRAIAELINEDKRYTFDAYAFVFEGLSFAQNVLGLGVEGSTSGKEESGKEEPEAAQRHVTGQQLCQALRRFALHQYGYMAKPVLNSWGVHTTGDFGEIVFSLINIGQMRKTPQDNREDFDDVYDFDTAFREEFKITPSE